MSGHSKWSTIKHKKAAADAKKGKEFSKLAKLIIVESKACGGDASSPSLKAIIEKAKAANMPKENIERAVAKGKGSDAGSLLSITYELYGPGGIAILAETLTDNNNRTNQELKHLLSKLGYQLAEPGAASWAFRKEQGAWIPTVLIPVSDEDVDGLEKLVEALEEHDDVQDVYTNAE
ncbi:MAG: YebC/PmpR family DNA-binding transcriptional regulator [Candidatus Pacebacteria bacterium]|nr:YebC/PmpR family DNA-binding transcriptional regulator [Candidatus Paceibacterota bacterium]